MPIIGGATNTSAPGLTPTTVKTSAYTATAGDLVRVDTSNTMRTVTDVTAAGNSATITAAGGNFTANDVGREVSGLDIATGTTIAAVVSSTAATLSVAMPSYVSTSSLVVSIGTPGVPITLPGSVPAGAVIGVRREDGVGWPITVTGSGGDTINGSASAAVVPSGVTHHFRKDSGSNWVADLPSPTFVTGQIINAIGDSISPLLNSSTGYMHGSGSSGDVLWWAHLLSNGRMLEGKIGGIVGARIDQMIRSMEAGSTGYGGHWCLVQTGTNDAVYGHTPATWAGYLRQMVASILVHGQRPILTTPPPNYGIADRQRMDRYRRFLIAYGAANGYPVVDFYTALVDPATGSYQSQYDKGDGIHPSVLGKRVMGQVLADTLSPLLAAQKSPLPMVNSATTSHNFLANGMFLTDTNSDGVPDGFTKSGAGTVGLVTGDSAITGNALRLSDAATSGATAVTASAISGTSGLAGHRIAFTGLVKVVGASLTETVTLSCTAAGVSSAIFQLRGLKDFSIATPGWQRFYCEGTVPVGATSLGISLSTIGGANVDVQVAQLGLYDLTATGL